MNITPEAQQAAREELWRRGDLRYKLDSTQRKIYDVIEKGGRRVCLLCSRRLGKSFCLVMYCVSQAIKRPNIRISYAAPFGRDASEIATDLMTVILEDCPEDIRPEYKVATKEYVFHNGSTIRFAGLNAEHANQLRGRKADLFCVDEFSLVDDLKHAIQDVALPMTLTTGGRLLFATTPARSPSHESTGIIKKMAADGQVVTFTLLDNVRVSREIKAEYLIEAGENPENIDDILDGKRDPESTTALREYWCRLDVTDADSAVVPEFTAQAQKEIVLPDYPRVPYYDVYTAVDPGFTDKTGALFAWWDFNAKKLVIEEEFLLSKCSTYDIAQAVKSTEEALWGFKQPLVRVLDLDLRLISDLAQEHGLVFQPYNRADAEGGIDLVRNMVRRRELVIKPNCINLIRQLKNAVYNRKGTDFERTAEEGHFDLIAALRMLVRTIIRNKNPYPPWFNGPGFGHHGGGTRKETKSVFSDTPLGRKFAKKWG